MKAGEGRKERKQEIIPRRAYVPAVPQSVIDADGKLWTVMPVKFLRLMSEDGEGSIAYIPLSEPHGIVEEVYEGTDDSGIDGQKIADTHTTTWTIDIVPVPVQTAEQLKEISERRHGKGEGVDDLKEAEL